MLLQEDCGGAANRMVFFNNQESKISVMDIKNNILHSPLKAYFKTILTLLIIHHNPFRPHNKM